MFLSYIYDMRIIKSSQKIIVGLILLAIAVGIWLYFYASPPSGPQPLINLYLHQQDKVIAMDLEEYIKGTVAAEMPATFEIEALKAQAVCARTYAVKKIITQAAYPKGADLSDDIKTSQAFVPLQDFAFGNPGRADLLKRIDLAVESTRGEIMIYDSQPIDALYCSTCGGRTENASAVWGGNIPYLQSVNCGSCQSSAYYQQEVTLNNAVINDLVGGQGNNIKIKVLSRTPGGRPQKISINGHTMDTVSMRQELNLPSTWMEFTTSSQNTKIKSRGYGHGVGLCQYGANGMAQQGKDYRQILKKYYSGISFYELGYE